MISNPINIGTNIAIERAMNLKFEKTSLNVFVIYTNWSRTCLKTENGCAPAICNCPSEATIKNPGVPLTP